MSLQSNLLDCNDCMLLCTTICSTSVSGRLAQSGLYLPAACAVYLVRCPCPGLDLGTGPGSVCRDVAGWVPGLDLGAETSLESRVCAAVIRLCTCPIFPLSAQNGGASAQRWYIPSCDSFLLTSLSSLPLHKFLKIVLNE